ncbi:hypothetical protein QVD99_005968 [Batrachochytrium dendrobatidis]|nr:hypothetical protein QVD99_005968 [Batrachochytrium dendrobatidis]
MFRNFYVLHKTGKLYFSKNFQGDVLDQGLVVGFSSSISSFCKTLLGEGVREVTSLSGRIVYKEVGDFVFVVHCNLSISSNIVQGVVSDVISICELLFGASHNWDKDTFDLFGAQDIINMYFARTTYDPSTAVGGLSQVFVDRDVLDRLDNLLAYLESQEGVCSNGTMLVLGESVLHSRMSLVDTRMILQYHKARGFGPVSIRYTPVFISGAWRSLYSIRMNSFVLFVTTFIDKPYSLIEKKVYEFQTNLIQYHLNIPTEEPPVLLRLYAKRETLAMLYNNTKTGATLFPELRPGPEVQQKEILNAFWTLFSDASNALRVSGVTEFSICKELYRFYARCEGIHKLYVLFSSETSFMDVPNAATEILKNIKNVVPK